MAEQFAKASATLEANVSAAAEVEREAKEAAAAEIERALQQARIDFESRCATT